MCEYANGKAKIWLRQLEQKHQLTHIDLAQRAGISPWLVTGVFTAFSTPSKSTLEKICAALSEPMPDWAQELTQ